MEIANVEMAAAWDGPEGEHWSRHADRYERVTRRHWRRLLDAVPISSAMNVLDVGCGTGRSTRDVGRAAASALGVDLSSQMLELARRRALDEGLANVRFRQADAQVHPFEPEVFDLAVSRFGIMFFNDPVAAFTNIGRALRPAAGLAALVWRDLAHNEWLLALREALAAGRTLPEPPPNAPGMFGLADADHVRAVLADAGYVDIELEEVNEPVEPGSDAEDAFAFVRTIGPAQGLLEDLDEPTRGQALEALRRTVADHETDEGVLIPSAAWLITATKP